MKRTGLTHDEINRIADGITDRMNCQAKRWRKKADEQVEENGRLRKLLEDRTREVNRLYRDYELFEEMSPPDVSRVKFVQWCFDAWECEMARKEREAAEAAETKVRIVTAPPGLIEAGQKATRKAAEAKEK